MYQTRRNHPPLEERLVPIRGENFFSFFSRLAARKQVSAPELAAAMGAAWRDFVRIDSEELSRMAQFTELSQPELDELISWTPVEVYRNWLRLRGELFYARSVRNARVRGCVACLRDDLTSHAGSNTLEHLSFRAEWEVREISLCLKHNVLLTPFWTATRDTIRYDHLSQSGLLHSLVGGAPSVSVSPGGYDFWITKRLNGRADSTWLSDLPLYPAAKFCEQLGELLLKVRQVTPSSDDVWLYMARNAGFEVASKGEASIVEALGVLSSTSAGVKNAFGPLMNMGELSGDTRVMFQPLIDVLLKAVVNNFPLRPGAKVLGETVQEPQLVSLSSLAEAEKVSSSMMRAFLQKHEVKILGRGADTKRLGVRIADLEVLPRSRPDLIKTHEIYRRLGLRLTAFNTLVSEGLLKPAQESEIHGRIWAPEQVSDFLERLRRVSKSLHGEEQEWQSLVTLQKPFRATLGRMLQAALDGHLVIHVPDRDDFSITEIRALRHSGAQWGLELRRKAALSAVEDIDVTGLPLNQAARELGLQKDNKLKRLIELGAVEGALINYKSGRTVGYMSEIHLRYFSQRYLTTSLASREFGMPRQRLDRLIAKARLSPLQVNGEIFSNIWERKALVEIIEDFIHNNSRSNYSLWSAN